MLLVTANPSVRAHLAELLGVHFVVRAVPDGKTALRALRDVPEGNPPPVLVVTSAQPADGLAVITLLRSEPGPHPPVLLLLEGTEPFTAPPGLEPDDLVRGRFDRGELLRRTHLLSRLARAEHGARARADAATATQQNLARWQQAYHGVNETLQTLKRFMPAAVVEAVQDGRAMRPPERRELTMLFSDIRGFTDATEFHGPQDTIDLLNDYLPEVQRIIQANGGVLDKFLGDGILAYFGDKPGFSEDHALRAVKTALAMQLRLEELKVDWFERGFLPVGIGIGINTGPTTLGTLGSGERMEYTVIGSPVNMAARLQALARGGEVILGQSTFARVQGLVAIRETRKVNVKGFDDSIQVYALAGLLEATGLEGTWFGE